MLPATTRSYAGACVECDLLLRMGRAWMWCRRGLIAIAVLIAAAWGVAEASQWLLRWRAERLLADFRALSMKQSTWADVQPILRHWEKWGTYEGACPATECSYRVRIEQFDNRILVGSEDEHAPNRLPRLLNHLGLRASGVLAGFRVANGKVSDSWFGEIVLAPQSHWGRPNGAYYAELAASSGTRSTIGTWELTHMAASHSNRSYRFRQVGFETIFTPQEAPEIKRALMDFQLSCITRWSPCVSEGDILPWAFKEYETENRVYEDAMAKGGSDYTRWDAPHCPATVDLLAREWEDIVVAQVEHATKLEPSHEDVAYSVLPWQLTIRVEKTLKGSVDVGASGTAVVKVTLAKDASASGEFPFHHVLLFGDTESREFVPGECGVAESSPANMAMAMRGAAEDFSRRY